MERRDKRGARNGFEGYRRGQYKGGIEGSCPYTRQVATRGGTKRTGTTWTLRGESEVVSHEVVSQEVVSQEVVSHEVVSPIVCNLISRGAEEFWKQDDSIGLVSSGEGEGELEGGAMTLIQWSRRFVRFWCIVSRPSVGKAEGGAIRTTLTLLNTTRDSKTLTSP